MYSKKSTIINNKQDLSNYIEGFDVYNSEILLKLNDPGIQREDYEITTYEYRPDLIAEDYYGDSSYMGIVLLTCARGLETYTRGSVLKLIPKRSLDEILNSI